MIQGWSEEAASCFFLQLCWELLSNEHTWSLSSLETFGRNCLCVSALALKILSEGNPGDQERLRLFSLSSYVENRYLMKILYACLRWKRLEWIVCVCQPWAWKIHWREIRAIKSSCVCFLCPVLFGITISSTYLILVFIGTDLSELCPSALGNFLGILKSFFSKEFAQTILYGVCSENFRSLTMFCNFILRALSNSMFLFT